MKIVDKSHYRLFLLRRAFQLQQHVINREIVGDRAQIIRRTRLGASVAGERRKFLFVYFFPNQFFPRRTSTGNLRGQRDETAAEQQRYRRKNGRRSAASKHQSLLTK